MPSTVYTLELEHYSKDKVTHVDKLGAFSNMDKGITAAKAHCSWVAAVDGKPVHYTSLKSGNSVFTLNVGPNRTYVVRKWRVR